MTKSQIVDRLLDPGIVAVIRVDSAATLLPVCDALLSGGVTGLEITMTSPDTLGAIAQASRQFAARGALVGVGTVLDPETCRAAILAGAEFVVPAVHRGDVPALRQSVGVRRLHAHGGADGARGGGGLYKLFPADGLGPKYIQNLLAPLPMLRLIPTGGVTVETAGDFLRAGCAALGAGSSLVAKEFVKNGDWAGLTTRAKAFVAAVQKARSK